MAVGISAPQGCGKTTLTNALVERFAASCPTDEAMALPSSLAEAAPPDGGAKKSRKKRQVP